MLNLLVQWSSPPGRNLRGFADRRRISVAKLHAPLATSTETGLHQGDKSLCNRSPNLKMSSRYSSRRETRTSSGIGGGGTRFGLATRSIRSFTCCARQRKRRGKSLLEKSICALLLCKILSSVLFFGTHDFLYLLETSGTNELSTPRISKTCLISGNGSFWKSSYK